MNKAALSVVAVLLLLGAGTWYVTTRLNTTTLTLDEDAQARALVTEFGTKLQFVPLIAPSAGERRVAMEAYYGPYVAPELIAAWAPEGAEALGRYSSSPWPERIEIVEVRKEGKLLVVEGNVLEVTSTEAGQGKAAAAIYPVTLTLERRGDRLLITKMQKGAYSQIPHRQTVVGFWECLPVKNPDEPHTLECALGIAIDQSDGHLAVNTSLMSTYPVDFPTGTKVRVEGVVVPANQLSSNQWQKYDIDGIISATVIEKVE